MLDRLVPPPEGLAFPEGTETVILEAADGIHINAVTTEVMA